MPSRLVAGVCVLVCDSWGVGDAPDAEAYGDGGSDTLAHTARAVGGLRVPSLEGLGLGTLPCDRRDRPRADAGTAAGRATEVSAGKDTITGHWEMMGVRLDTPFPPYERVPARDHRAVHGGDRPRGARQRPASGTEIIADLGATHLATGEPIVYTSGDSVFQVATHVDVVPLRPALRLVRDRPGLLVGPHRVGRVIARPFDGEPGAFVRRPERRDYSVAPPGPTVLDHLVAAGRPCSGSARSKTSSRTEASPTRRTPIPTRTASTGRSPPSATAAMTSSSRTWWTSTRSTATATTRVGTPPRSRRSTDACPNCSTRPATGCSPEGGRRLRSHHTVDRPSRERLAAARRRIAGGPVDLGIRASFADLGATVLDALGVGTDLPVGESFASALGLG